MAATVTSCTDPPGEPLPWAEVFPGVAEPAAISAALAGITFLPRTAFTTVGAGDQLQPMGQIRRVTIHHTGLPEPWTSEDQHETARHLEWIRQFHTEAPPTGRGWGDIGYHFAIDRAGRIWQSRQLMYQGAHVQHHNSGNIGLAMLGNFDLQGPAAAQIRALDDFVAFLRRIYALARMEIWMHRELADQPTSCPGAALATQVQALRGF